MSEDKVYEVEHTEVATTSPNLTEGAAPTAATEKTQQTNKAKGRGLDLSGVKNFLAMVWAFIYAKLFSPEARLKIKTFLRKTVFSPEVWTKVWEFLCRTIFSAVIWGKVWKFLRRRVFTPTVGKIIRYLPLTCIELAIGLLCAYQVAQWGLTVAQTYKDYWQAIVSFDVVNIVMMAIMLLFVTIMIVLIIKGLVKGIGHLVKRAKESWFNPLSMMYTLAPVATLYAFALVSSFLTDVFADKTLLISTWLYGGTLRLMLVLVAIYALIRLLMKDFRGRVWAVACSVAAIALALFMFNQGIGNFAWFVANDCGTGLSLAQISLIDSLRQIFVQIDMSRYFLMDLTDSLAVLCTFLQFVCVIVARVLPYAALSLVGYLIYGVACSKYVQYYQLRSAQKVSVVMLVLSIMSLASAVVLNVITTANADEIASEVLVVDYTSGVITIALCVAMIVLTSLPWKFYRMSYKRHFAEYKKNGGGY